MKRSTNEHMEDWKRVAHDNAKWVVPSCYLGPTQINDREMRYLEMDYNWDWMT